MLGAQPSCGYVRGVRKVSSERWLGTRMPDHLSAPRCTKGEGKRDLGQRMLARADEVIK
jgi:hypothetical protein